VKPLLFALWNKHSSDTDCLLLSFFYRTSLFTKRDRRCVATKDVKCFKVSSMVILSILVSRHNRVLCRCA